MPKWNRFQFPTNGNVSLDTAAKGRSEMTPERYVSIPYERERIFRLETFDDAEFVMYLVSIPYERERIFRHRKNGNR